MIVTDCSICMCSMAAEINKLKKDYPKISHAEMVRILRRDLPDEFGDVKPEALQQRVSRHFKNNHELPYAIRLTDLKQRKQVDPQKELQQSLKDLSDKKITWEDFKDKLLMVAYQNMVDNPEKIKVRDFLQAEAIQNQKDRLDLDAKNSTIEKFVLHILSGGLQDVSCPGCGLVLLEKDKGHKELPEKLQPLEGEIIQG